jgi:hypothetical protein
MIASFSVFISQTVTGMFNVFKHYLGSLGKKTVCKSCAKKWLCKLCANAYRPGICANLVQRFWPAVARGWPPARSDHHWRGKGSNRSKIALAVVL